jgi:heme exporter protein B
VDSLRQVYGILKKDIVLELRTREMLISMFLYVMMTMIIYNYAFNAEKVDLTPFGGGLLWIAFIFTALLGLNRSFVHEKDEGCLDGLLLSPMDRSLIYVAKTLSNLIFLSIIETVTVPIFTVFFIKYSYFSKLPIFILGIVLANIAIASLGTFLSTMAVNIRNGDLLLPILFLPLIIPALWAAVTISGSILAGPISKNLADQISTAIKLLFFYDIIFIIIPYGLYDFVIGE